MTQQIKSNLSWQQISGLVLLRVVIGWHFAYEGLAKLLDDKWSAYFYLLDSKGWFQNIFFDTYHGLE